MTTFKSLRIAAGLGVALAGLLLPFPPAAAAEACPNEALRTGPSARLPDCRAYEMVSPVYKGGYSARAIEAVAPDGESISFFSLGAFAGAPGGAGEVGYLARRGAAGWSTAPLMPPAALLPYRTRMDVSSTLESVMAFGKPGPNDETAFLQGTEAEFLLHATDTPDTAENWELGGGMVLKPYGEEHVFTPAFEGSSADLCHLLFGKVEVPALPEAVGSNSALYELDRGCGGGEPSLRLVGVRNKLGPHGEPEPIDRYCQVWPGEPNKQDTFNALADGGREIFFTTNVNPAAKENCGVIEGAPTNPKQLFVRLDGARTLEVSKPLGGCGPEGEVPCPGASARPHAVFQGASEDGSRVFFTTTAPLAPGDEDEGNDLYMATIGCPPAEPGCEAAARQVTSLVQVSHDPNPGEAAELPQSVDMQGVVRLALEGSRVYFVAPGLLDEGPNAEGMAPAKGADNLYAYDTASGETTFVADLCSGPQLSGAVEDPRCPAGLDSLEAGRNDQQLWLVDAPEAQTTADGRFLVFSTYARLTADDTDTARDVYRYDAATGALDRVSLGEAGHDANGNDDGFDAQIVAGHTGGNVRDNYEMNSRAISEDGSRIVFSSAEPLSPAALNGLANVYEWHKEPSPGEAAVSLISSGEGSEAIPRAVISPAGNDIFFPTSQGLAPQDGDGATDVYDARANGGFAPAPAPRQPCSGDACQGPLTNPAPLLVPGSVSQAPGGSSSARPARHKHRRHRKKGKAAGRSRKTASSTGRGRR